MLCGLGKQSTSPLLGENDMLQLAYRNAAVLERQHGWDKRLQGSDKTGIEDVETWLQEDSLC